MRGLARVLAVGLFACVAGAAPLVACGGGAGGELFGTGQDGGDASSGSGAHACVPGQQVACACPGGATGAQVCTADGQGFGTCEGCGSLDGTMNPAPDSASPPHDATTIEDTAPPGDAASVDTGGTGGKDAGEDGAPGDGSAMNGTDATADATLSDAGQDATLIDAGEDATLIDAGQDASNAEDSGPSGDAGPCLPGLTCDVTCDAGITTTVTGTVFDPSGKNKVANAIVYVPAKPLAPIPRGLSATDPCSCSALYPSGAITSTTTGTDGSFTLRNVPVGAQVPLVVQIGKWRRKVPIRVDPCTDNPQTAGSITLPGTVPAGDTDDAMPDIAVSTGSADTLECILVRMGVSDLEYVAGSSTAGHVHIFSGGSPTVGGHPGLIGLPETHPMPGAPASSAADGGLWSGPTDLARYDMVLLSCEGGETYNANPAVLEEYVNGGGRVLASHYHYAWFAGPLGSGQTYAAPSDWGSNLATWSPGGASTPVVTGGIVDTTLNAGAGAFSKGAAFEEWLADAGALGRNTAPAGELSIYQARFNATVAAANAHSQPWIVSDGTSTVPGSALAFSFDTPVVPAAGAPYCGRAFFTDLHVSGDPSETDTENAVDGSAPPHGCATTGLSVQEQALEYLLFDLASCVVPDSTPLPADGGIPTGP